MRALRHDVFLELDLAAVVRDGHPVLWTWCSPCRTLRARRPLGDLCVRCSRAGWIQFNPDHQAALTTAWVLGGTTAAKTLADQLADKIATDGVHTSW